MSKRAETTYEIIASALILGLAGFVVFFVVTQWGMIMADQRDMLSRIDIKDAAENFAIALVVGFMVCFSMLGMMNGRRN
jgi:fructose-specific phosphotransferase system IIC component